MKFPRIFTAAFIAALAGSTSAKTAGGAENC